MPMSILSDIWDTTVRVASAVTELFLHGDYVWYAKSLWLFTRRIKPLH